MADFLSMLPPDTPAAFPPLGVIPNFINPENRAPQFYITSAICLTLVLACVSLRLYAKICITNKTGTDDYSALLATALLVVAVSLYTSSFGNVFGRHEWDVLLVSITSTLQRDNTIASILYGIAIFFIKLSLFLLYLNIFSSKEWLRCAVYVGIGLNFLIYATNTAVYVGLCTPSKGENWLDALLSIKCRNAGTTLGIVISALNILSDFYCLILPLPAVWSLQLPTRKKIGVSAIFVIGSTACIASILGLVYRIKLRNNADLTWTTIPVFILNMVEVSTAIICSCMPAFASVARHHSSKLSAISSILGNHFRTIPSKVFGSSGNGISKGSFKAGCEDPESIHAASWLELSEGPEMRSTT